MDRVPYRRITPPRDGVPHKHSRRQSETITVGETILGQSIISGLLLVVVLLICLIDIAPMVSLRQGLRQVLAGATTLEELTAEAQQFRLDWQNRNYAHPAEELPEVPFPALPLGIQNPPVEAAENPSPPLYTLPLTAEEPLNPQIPGPSAVPGLWD